MNDDPISSQWLRLFVTLNESQKRIYAAIKALEIGYGGVSKVSLATGLSRTTVTQGVSEIKVGDTLACERGRVRSAGGGRKATVGDDSGLTSELEKILCETTAGDPMSSIRWTCKSVRNIASELRDRGHAVSYRTVHRLLIQQGYSLQSNRKSLSRAENPNRDLQFRKINRKVSTFLNAFHPVISVDAKKKELVGKFKNSGAEWRKAGDPERVEDHDFPSRGIGKATPYGTYDIARNEGFVNIGISNDTADFAVNSIARWWTTYGCKAYPKADRILICADGGGSNGSRNRLWKVRLQEFANCTGLKVFVCHYPPGTSKWNKIEHRLFSFISLNWRGKPLESFEAIVQLIGNTTTSKGLKVNAKIDKRIYKKGKKISDAQFSALSIKYSHNLPKWNYYISPKT